MEAKYKHVTSTRHHCVLLYAIVFIMLLPLIESHGILLIPRSRNMYLFYNQKPATFWNPQGLNGGGASYVSRNGVLKWPNGIANLCGGLLSDQAWMKPTAVQASYRAGAVINVHTILYNNHGGQFRVAVCPKGAVNRRQCKPLISVVTKKPYFIPPLPKCQCVYATDGRTSGYPSVIDGFRIYNYKSEDQFNGYPAMITQWRLPAGYKCTGCFLQWWWITSSTCQPPCVFGKDKYCRPASQQAYCGAKTGYPEEFRNCADIEII